ncbi:hypothetical protein JCM30760_09990 [Thiomicrorhabdus hydrogeniphila]
MLQTVSIQINKGYRSLVAKSSIKKGQIILEESPFAIVSSKHQIQFELAQRFGWPWVLTFELFNMISNHQFKHRFELLKLHSNTGFVLDETDKKILKSLEQKLGYRINEVLKLYYKVVTNNFFLTYKLNNFGCVLYEFISAMNHSCIPNAYVTNELTETSCIGKIHALEDIGEGEEITISYLGSEFSVKDSLALVKAFPEVTLRQKQIFAEHFFECKCIFCKMQNACN